MTTTDALPLSERQQKGLIIAATMPITQNGADFVVPSQSLNGKYRVDGSAKTCSCPDFELRQQPCKHVFAVEYVQRRETTVHPSGATTVTETKAVRFTYAQNWPAYNAAQTTEKEHFVRLLRDLVGAVAEPERTITGRKPLPLRDMLFSAAFKVYSGFSGRRSMTDLRAAHSAGLVDRLASYNSVFRVIESDAVTPILHQLIEASSLPLREVEQDFAADSTGFGTSTFFRYYSMKYQHEQVGRQWIKTHAMVGTKTNVVTAVVISGMNEHDSPQFPALVEKTAQNFTMREISADKAYSGRDNLALVESHGALPFIPFRSNAKPDPKAPAWNRLFHLFALNRDGFLAHYHKRSNVEATFSMVKRVFGDSVRSKTPTAQKNEVLLKIICHNIRCLIHEMHELGLVPTLEKIVCPKTAGAAPELLLN
ncbi:MAG: transposase [Bradyrhizobium sp.]